MGDAKGMLLFLAFLAIAVGVYFALGGTTNFLFPKRGEEITPCTMEALVCPDGTSVGRVGPDCAFAPCPGTTDDTDTTDGGGVSSEKGGLAGVVLVGPTCPVVQVGMEEECADKPLSTTLTITDITTGKEVDRFTSASDGTFSIEIAEGDYRIENPLGASSLPRCSAESHVERGEIAVVVISCDSGIR